MSGKIVLVTGGAKSGKSALAERYVTSLGVRVAYIATAQVGDEEMAERVRVHQDRRPNQWLTLEAPYDAERAMRDAALNAEAVLFDCLTLYTSNLMLAPDAPKSTQTRKEYIKAKIVALLTAAEAVPTVVFVTNEVGMGIVPDNAMAREYRDLAGMVNEQIAAAADEVYLVVSGMAVEIKKLAVAINPEVTNG
jgi:adenosylcobinamide kinase/adenosylcobinamide-phosphate guanylyltransferase